MEVIVQPKRDDVIEVCRTCLHYSVDEKHIMGYNSSRKVSLCTRQTIIWHGPFNGELKGPMVVEPDWTCPFWQICGFVEEKILEKIGVRA